MHRRLAAWIAGGLLVGVTATALAETPLIPREVLFGNPDKAQVRISPDGKHLSFLGPVDNVLNVWVGPVDDLKAAKPITRDKSRGIRQYFWPFDGEHVIYIQDKDGDENWRVYSVRSDGSEEKLLTPGSPEKEAAGGPPVQARVIGVSHKYPKEILIGLNERNPQFHDVYRVNIETGDKKLVLENEGFLGFVTDDEFRIRLALRVQPDGGMEILKREDEKWASFATIESADALTTSPITFDKSGDVLYLRDSRGRNTAALVAVDLKTGDKQVIAEDPRADLGEVMMQPIEHKLEAVGFTVERRQWKILDKSVEDDFAFLMKLADGEFDVVGRTRDDKRWIVSYVQDNGPVKYYLYDRPDKKAVFLTSNRTALEGQPLVRMHAVTIPARDQQPLVCYLSLPLDSDTNGDARPERPVPTVMLVHGGPWARDEWGYDPYHQWLANRGYAVIAVNFRGSTGLGKEFTNKGDREWGAKMHDDLVDVAHWLAQEKIAPPDKIAIMGGSYGGYAALAGMTFTPDLFACGVDMFGPSNLITLLESVPPYWKPMLDLFTQRVGDYRTEEGKKLLTERSPLTHVDKIQRPLLIGQGANDPRVKQAESDQIVKAMQEKKIPVTYVLFADEGHGFARPQNNMAFNAITEAFLAEHLGGRVEPVGDDFEGSTVKVPAGAEYIKGLADALKSTEKS